MHKRQAKDTFSSGKIVHRVLNMCVIQDCLAPGSPVAPSGQLEA